MTDQTPPTKRRTWVGEWMRSEAFWRDVASRALAGLIVVAVGALVAGVLGYVPGSTVLRVVLALLVVVVALVGFIGLVIALGGWHVRATRRRRAAGKSTKGSDAWLYVWVALLFIVVMGGFTALLMLVALIP